MWCDAKNRVQTRIARQRISFVIGLTGNIATGKSTVLAYLAERGAQVIDADKVAHQSMAPGGAAYAQIVAAWGAAILAPDQTIDRRELANIVFADPAQLARLEAIVHPAVFALIQDEVESSQADVIVIESIKLLESGRLLVFCDEVWVVTASKATQLRRLAESRGMAADVAEQRMAAQSAAADKIARADQVIHNDGTQAELYSQLAAQWDRVLQCMG